MLHENKEFQSHPGPITRADAGELQTGGGLHRISIPPWSNYKGAGAKITRSAVNGYISIPPWSNYKPFLKCALRLQALTEDFNPTLVQLQAGKVYAA